MKVSSHLLAGMVGEWRAGPGPAHRRLSDVLRLLVLDGRLPLTTELPGERDLAAVLGVSRTTVAAAYRTLAVQNYVQTRHRARAVVRLPEADWAGPRADPEEDVIDLSHAAPAAPVEVLHSAFAAAIERLPRHFERHGYDQHGTSELREALAAYYVRRGLPTSAGQILVTSGAQHALALLIRVLVRAGSRVLIEHPSYPHAIKALSDAKARLQPIPLTGDGWDVERLRAGSTTADLAYLIPDFHNPTGLCMAADTRRRLRVRCQLVIDETMADLGLEAPSPAPFAVHDATTITIGSLSKSIWGGLRIGWIRGNTTLLTRLTQARPGIDLGTPVVEQLAAAWLLNAHAERRSSSLEQLRIQRDAALAALQLHLPDLRVARPPGGITLWGSFSTPIARRLAMIAPDYGVTIAAGPRFGVGGAFARSIRVPYVLDPDRLAEGIARLANAYAALDHGFTGAHRPGSLV